MKVRITKQPEGKRAYYVMSGDRRRPAMAGVSGVPREQGKAELARLIADVSERMRSGEQRSLGI